MTNTSVRRLVLDILKPLDPSVIEISKSLANIEGITAINLVVYEVDRKTETIKTTIEGDDIDFEKIKKVIEKFGAVVHSVDGVVTGKKIIEESKTPQDMLMKVP